MYRVLCVVVILTASTFAYGSEMDLATPGAGSVTIPTGYEWTDVTVQCWSGGGGGGGGYYSDGYYGGGGGGGGAYGYNSYATLVSGSYNYYIGAGGVGAAQYNNGSAGGNTIWNYGGAQDIYVTGGGGGDLGGSGGSAGLVLAGTGFQGGGGGGGEYPGGGSGESAGPSGPGGTGGNGQPLGYGGDGGTGYGDGGQGADALATSGTGGFPGGGGGGGSYYDGAPGANGEIIITYTSQAVPEPASVTLLGTAMLRLAAVYLRRVAGRTAKPTSLDQHDDAQAILSFPSRSSPASVAARAA
jgi:hypothetical protein